MNPEEMQVEQGMEEAHPEMSPDEAMAALAISTRLSEQMMAQQAPQGEDMPVEGENGAEMPQGGTETPEAEEVAPEQDTAVLDDFKTEYQDEMKTFKKEIAKMIKDEVGGLKQMIAETLNEEEE